MNIIAYGNDTGSKSWRMEHPFKYLRKKGIDAWVSDEAITDKALDWADIIVMNSVTHKPSLAKVYEAQQTKGKKIVIDVDDWFDLNPDSPFVKEHELQDAKSTMTRMIEVADLVTCTTRILESKIAKINKKVRILKNYMDLEFWDVSKEVNTSDKIRIGWAGSITHYDDLQMVINPLKRIMDEYPAEVVFVGDTRLQDHFKGYPVTTMLGVPFEAWPMRLSGLRLDIGLAPLKATDFNKSKSNIKWQEYSIAKIPGIYSPTVYEVDGFEPKFGIIALDEDHWYRAIKHYIDYPQRREEVKENSYQHVTRNYSLEKHINEWIDAYTELTQKL